MIKRITIFFCVAILLMASGCAKKGTTTGVDSVEGKKILHIDSYASDFQWCVDIETGIQKVLKDTKVVYKLLEMDTKNHTEEEFKLEAAKKAKAFIEEFKPDIVIANDDNAAKYLIEPFYKNAALPFVFCGINWDASIYGMPYDNVTGMEEVTLVPQTIDHLKKYAKGTRLGFIAADTLSENKNLEYIKKKFGIPFDKEYSVKTFDEFKEKYKKVQSEVDILLLYNYTGIKDWNDDAAAEFIYQNAKIPSGTMDDWVAKFTLLGLVKTGVEQGEWSAKTALDILKGKSPKDIPITQNVKGKIMLNMKMAKKLGIVFDDSIMQVAELIATE